MAKGGEDNPASVLIDESGNTVKIDQSGNNNNVDANITNDSSNPVPVTISNGESSGPVEYRLVGYSTATREGDVWLSEMHEACQDDFGQEARMCTSSEVRQSPELTGLAQSRIAGWVQPIIVGVRTTSTA